MKTGYFLNVVDPSMSEEKKMNVVGRNTGNLLFQHSLKNTLDMEIINLSSIRNNSEEFYIREYANFVTSELIWIQENADLSYLRPLLDFVKDRPLIPISTGIQSWKFKRNYQLHQNTVHILQEISERCTIAVRGEYSAEILNKYRVKNLEVIGCPSVYYGLDYQMNIQTIPQLIPQKICSNFRTFYGNISIPEKHFLTYLANRKISFVEQTPFSLSDASFNDTKMEVYLNDWYSKNTHMFFDAMEWSNFMRSFDFNLGSRFHGNVVALWNRIPSLFFAIDSRMREMCSTFRLPTIEMSEFDQSKPISYYYEKADYTEFNRQYPVLLDRYIDFLKKNNLHLKKTPDEYYDRKLSKIKL